MARPAFGFEFFDQPAFGGGGKAVAHRVGDYRDAAGTGDCLHGFGQLRPLVADIGGFAFAEIFVEGLLGAADDALLAQKFGDMGARHGFGAGTERQRAFVGAENAFFFELGGDLAQAFFSAAAQSGQQALQIGVVFVEIETDDVDGAAAPAGGDFDAAD